MTPPVPVDEAATSSHPAPSVTDPPGHITEIPVPLGRRVMVIGDLLLSPAATASSLAVAHDLADSLDQWEGPGVVIICGNLCAGPAPAADTDSSSVQASLEAHPEFLRSIRDFSGRDESRILVMPGRRDPETGTDPAVGDFLRRNGADVADIIELSLATAAGIRRVIVRPGEPENLGLGGLDDDSDVVRPWLRGFDRLEDPRSPNRFVSSRTLYRRFGRYVWVPPLLAIVVAFIFRLTFVYRTVYHLVRRASGPRREIFRAYSASWSSRLVFTIIVIVALELLVAMLVTIVSRRIWRTQGGGALPAPWLPQSPPDAGKGASSGGLMVDDSDALDMAREIVGDGATGLIVGGGLRAELTHLGNGFYASPGGSTEIVREHSGRFGLPPVFLHHRQASWLELETGADLHVRLLIADVDLPNATALERRATGYRVVKGYKPAGDLYPTMVASWPRGASWPPAPDVAADRVRVRRIRRLAGGAIFVAGLVDLIAALNRPEASHLHRLVHFVPLGAVRATGALVALAGIGLMMLARGTLRGQRRAWVVAVLLLGASIVLHIVHGGNETALLITAGILVVLVVEREAFTSASDSSSIRSAFAMLVTGGVVAVMTATIAIEVSGKVRHHPLPDLASVIWGVIQRMVGIRSIAFPDSIDDWISPGLLAVGIGLAVVVLALLTRPVLDRGLSSRRGGSGPRSAHSSSAEGTDLDNRLQMATNERLSSARRAAEFRARDIVRRHGTGTLDYFALRDDKQWFFHRDSLVAFAVHNGACLVSPDPIGPHGERRHVWDAFRRYCDRNGWNVAIMAAAEEWLPIYRTGGMRHVYIGDEAVVNVQRFSLNGGNMKGLRQAVSRMGRYGYTVEFHDPAHLESGAASTLVELMQKNRRGDHERGFSMMLGRVFDSRDSGLLLTVVRDPSRAPVAMCQFVPSSAIRGYSLDLMRRDPGEHPNGLLDFALCSTIEHLRTLGQQGLSLNFAAMRSTLDGESGDGITQRVERWVLRRMSSVLQIESLWRFNAKYEPDWLPRYVVFDSAEQFGTALVSILRAESLSEVPVIGRFFVPSATRRIGGSDSDGYSTGDPNFRTGGDTPGDVGGDVGGSTDIEP